MKMTQTDSEDLPFKYAPFDSITVGTGFGTILNRCGYKNTRAIELTLGTATLYIPSK